MGGYRSVVWDASYAYGVRYLLLATENNYPASRSLNVTRLEPNLLAFFLPDFIHYAHEPSGMITIALTSETGDPQNLLFANCIVGFY